MLLPKIRFVLFFAALFFGGNAFSQAETHIKEDASVTKMREKRQAYRESKEYKFEGYRIFVNIFSNRRDAIKFQKDFNQRFTGKASCQIIYDEPNFKIYAGTYALKAEAESILARVRQAYPTAKIIKMPIPYDFDALE
jgi:hypothetical protein